ncbi:RHS repeat-associated core domain-containing protein, partial [Streptomyces sp. NPDC057010]|uniref:RHS repeat-associated core domain-containing protein n=1 Tax=Streptomyces sp. NPDC057010 TaxID=3345997 RepID=UPI0036D326FC
MRLVHEIYHDRLGEQALTYLYEPDSYVPLARIDQAAPAANDAEVRDTVYYFHNDVSGLPEELTDVDGELVWQARYQVWGNAVQEEWIARAPKRPASGEVKAASSPAYVPRPQNLRFQGQYLDRETGLYYNTFRFYDPDIGRFINPDPIGLNGGANLYQAGEGQSAIVKIKMQGYRSLDDTQAFNASKIPREASGEYTWHHMSDFDPKTGEVTMQLVKRDIHRSISHDGGVSQFQQHSGTKYDTAAARDFATEKGWRVKKPKSGGCH